jgi:hypothetical protein
MMPRLPSRAVVVCTMLTLLGLAPLAAATMSYQDHARHRAAPANAPCSGDCDRSGEVTIDEIIRGIDLALGNLPDGSCDAMDSNADGKITIDELVQAVNAALLGCPTPIVTTTATTTWTATSTATATPTATPSPSTTPTQTSSSTPTATLTVTPTSSATPSLTATASRTGTATATPTTAPEGLNIRVGSATGQPGERVTVSITLHTGGETIVATQNQILLDVRAPIAARGTRPNCTVNPAIEKDSTVFTFLPPECTASGNCELMRSIVISFADSTSIPDGSVLYTCAIDIAASTLPGDVVPLVCGEAMASGPRGELLEPLCIDGTITVGALVP